MTTDVIVSLRTDTWYRTGGGGVFSSWRPYGHCRQLRRESGSSTMLSDRIDLTIDRWMSALPLCPTVTV